MPRSRPGRGPRCALTELYALYDPAAALASIELALDVHSQAQVHTDVRRLLLIFGNLLDNALRYSPAHGRIELSARLSAGTATMEVRDQGPGIPEAEIPRVFERFRKAPDDHRAHSGLGLATVQSLVRQLGGSVSLHNRDRRPGSGRPRVPAVCEPDALKGLVCALSAIRPIAASEGLVPVSRAGPRPTKYPLGYLSIHPGAALWYASILFIFWPRTVHRHG